MTHDYKQARDWLEDAVYDGNEADAKAAETIRHALEVAEKADLTFSAEEMAKVREALAFYADETNHHLYETSVGCGGSMIEIDEGLKAKEALRILDKKAGRDGSSIITA